MGHSCYLIGALAALFTAWIPVAAQSPRLEAEAGAAILLRSAANDFRAAMNGGLSPSVEVGSTTAAFTKLCRSEIAGAGASRAMTRAEADRCRQAQVNVIELPLAHNAF